LKRSFSPLRNFVVCCATLFTLFGAFSLNAYAMNGDRHSHNPPIKQGPPIQCLDVSLSSVSNQDTVAVSNPPGGALDWQLYLHVSVTAPCLKNYLVTNIRVVGQVTGLCPFPSTFQTPPPIIFNGPYPLYPGAGYGQASGWQDRCVRFQNNKPVASLVPNSLNISISATGNTLNNDVAQQVTSDTLGILIWPL